MDASAYREAVYDVFSGCDRDVETRVERALEVGTRYLGLPIGFLTRIEDGQQEVVVATGDHDLLQPGETCPLEDAYCRATIESEGALAVRASATSAAISERAHDAFGLETYIGTKVVVDGDLYGTVCFADERTRDVAFSEAEETFIELLARLAGRALERRAHERERRERSERLAREKRRFEGIAEASFDVLFRLDDAAEFTYVSGAAERVLGYEPAELVGAPFAAFVAEGATERALGAYERVLDGEPVEALELDFRGEDGDVVTLEVNATPVTESGSVVGVQGVGRDVTARRERERELRIKDRAMDEARIGISIADMRRADDPLVYVNDGFERTTGYDAETALGRNCRFLQGPATDPDAVDRLRGCIDREESGAVELLNYRRDGTPFWNQVHLSPVQGEAGDVTHYLGFQTDVTERKRTEQLVRLLNRVLRHNLRNDMNALLGFGDHLQRDADAVPDDVGERISETAASLVALSERARELERYARRERSLRRLDPAALLEGVVGDCRERHPAATVDLTVRTQRDVCAGAELERAVSELLENALKHNPAAEPWAGVEVADDGEWVAFTVTDDGPGIAAMEAAVISRGEETPLEHGSGLGLWLINWVVTRYGGSFQVAAEGPGTVATIRLPGVGPDTAVEEVARPPTVLFR